VLALDPANVEFAYLRDCIAGVRADRPPDEYIAALFDRFAPRFDEKLVRELRYRGPELLAGAIYDPVRDELFSAGKGLGATLNGSPIRASDAATLHRALVCTGFPYDVRDTPDNNLAEYGAFTRQNRSVRELGSAAITLAAVAAGRLDGYWELVLGPWDVAAGLLLVEEAGGRVTDLRGGPLNLAAPRIVASNGRIHDAMLRTLASVRGH